MKANELMIGDWVMRKDTQKPYKIKAIRSDKYCYDNDNFIATDAAEDWSSMSYYEPIPLTAEILEKNGWEHFGIFMETRVDEHTRFGWTDRYGAVLYRNTHYMCDCKDVHTLQHALRLCGRNDLADNFKV